MKNLENNQSPAIIACPSKYLAATLLGLSLTAPASAFVMDMEGFAPPGGDTSELDYDPPNYGLSVQGDFSLYVDHGHYYSATHSLHTWATSDVGGTASDWFLHDDVGPMHIEHVLGYSFSVVSFEAGEWQGPFAGNPSAVSTTNNPIYVTGFLAGGGTITTTFYSDSTPSDGNGSNVDFELFTFGAGWDNLVALEFQTSAVSTEQFGYDNIIVNANAVPVPAAAWLFGSGLVSLLGLRQRRKRQA